MKSDLMNALRLIKDYCKATDGLSCIEGKCPIHDFCLKRFRDTPDNWEFEDESNIESDV